MRQCSEKAYAECKSPMRCKSREVAFYLPGSKCDDLNREKEKKPTNRDALRAMKDKELAEYEYLWVELTAIQAPAQDIYSVDRTLEKETEF